MTRVEFILPSGEAEACGAALCDLLPDGVLVSPARGKARSFRPGAAPRPIARVEGWLKNVRLRPALCARLRELGAQDVRFSRERARNWLAESKASFPVQRLGRFYVVPAWRKVAVPKGLHPIYLVQGQAFGTGLHNSTRLMLAFLERDKGLVGGKVLDVGAGSGILGFAALHFGADKVACVEIEPAACRELRENRAENGAASARMPVFCGRFPAVAGLKTARFDRVLANLTAPVLLGVMKGLVARLNTKGVLVMSGIHREEERDQVCAAARKAGLRVLGSSRRGAWWRVEASR